MASNNWYRSPLVKIAVQAFLDLKDTIASYAGRAGKLLRINSTEDGIDVSTDTDSDIHDAVSKKHASSTQFNQGVAGEINGLTEKTTLADDDLVLIEDSAASYAKKKSKKSNLLGGAITEGWQKVTEVDVSSDCDYVDFTGLDINSDWFYKILTTIKNPTASYTYYSINVEGDYTSTNYYGQYLLGNGTSASADRGNAAVFCSIESGDRFLSQVSISKDPDGYFRAFSVSSRNSGSSVKIESRAIVKTATVSNITQIRIQASETGGIGAGSKFILLRTKRS